MFLKKLYLFFILVSLSFFSFGKELPLSENLIQGKLPNGLEYFIYKNKKPENHASLNLIVKAGSLQESEQQLGLAHFLEHMAFNGTEKYEKNEMIKYLQSIGLNFGGDLNAYTSFEETVYQLSMPSTLKDLDTGIEVLREWSDKVALDEEDIKSEINIIIEEWRLRQGLKQRLGDYQKKLLYGNSFYSQRFPIGNPETIRGVTKELLSDFYTKWYQPSNMAVLVVGDFDTTEVEKLIKKHFSSVKNTPIPQKENYKIPLFEKDEVLSFFDPELTTTNMNIIWKENSSPINSEENLKIALEKNLLVSILNSRFSNTAKNPNSPYGYASSYNFSLNNTTGAFAVSSLIKEDNILPSIEDIFINLKDISLNGINPEILNLEKTNFLNALELTVKNKSSISNDTIIDSIKNYYLSGDTFTEPEDDFEIVKKIFEKISSDDIKNLANKYTNENFNIFITGNKSFEKNLPETKIILEKIEKIKKDNSINLSTNFKNLSLENLNLEKGKIEKISSKETHSDYILSNGIKLSYKETNFDKDKIFINITKGIGTSNLDYKNFINSIFMPNIITNSGVNNIDYLEIDNYFKGKNFFVSPYVNTYSHGFLISTDKENLDEAMNYFRNLILYPNISDAVLQSTLINYEEILKNKSASPRFLFSEKYKELLYSNDKRKKSLTLDDLKLVSKDNILEIFKFISADFSNSTINIVGSIDEKTMIDISEKYLSNLPTKDSKIEKKILDVNFPKDIVKANVIKGIDKKATVIITFPYAYNFSVENKYLYSSLSYLTDMILIEEIREKIGGVYSISSSANLDYDTFGNNYFEIYFNTDTERVDEVVEGVKKVISEIQKGNFDKNKIEALKENYRLSLEKSIKENSFWLQVLTKNNLINNYEFFTPLRYNNTINYESLVEFSKKAININNYVEVRLLPEKED